MKSKLYCFLQPPALPNCASLSLLLLRAVTGVAFILHGWGKIQSPFSWMGPEAPIPGIFQFLAAVSEFGGGIALILGLLTSLAALGLAFTMFVAFLTHAVMRGDPFVGQGGPSYELALIYFCISLVFIFIGAGKFSIDSKIFGNRSLK